MRTHFACPKTIADRISGLLNLLRWIFILSCQYRNVPIAKCFCSCFFYWPITSIKVNASHEHRYPIQEVEIEFGVGKIGDWLIRNCCCQPKYPTAIKSIHGYGAICNHFDRKKHSNSNNLDQNLKLSWNKKSHSHWNIYLWLATTIAWYPAQIISSRRVHENGDKEYTTATEIVHVCCLLLGASDNCARFSIDIFPRSRPQFTK